MCYLAVNCDGIYTAIHLWIYDYLSFPHTKQDKLSFINGINIQFQILELQGSSNLIWAQTEAWFDKSNKKLYWGLLWENCKGHICKPWESNSLSCNLILTTWITEVYLFAKQQIIWSKRNENIILFFNIFFTQLSLLPSRLRVKNSFHCGESS